MFLNLATSIKVEGDKMEQSTKDYITAKEVLAKLQSKGISFKRSHLTLLCKNGKFPQPVRLSERKIYWLEKDIDKYIADKLNEKETVEAEFNTAYKNPSNTSIIGGGSNA